MHTSRLNLSLEELDSAHSPRPSPVRAALYAACNGRNIDFVDFLDSGVGLNLSLEELDSAHPPRPLPVRAALHATSNGRDIDL